MENDSGNNSEDAFCDLVDVFSEDSKIDDAVNKKCYKVSEYKLEYINLQLR